VALEPWSPTTGNSGGIDFVIERRVKAGGSQDGVSAAFKLAQDSRASELALWFVRGQLVRATLDHTRPAAGDAAVNQLTLATVNLSGFLLRAQRQELAKKAEDASTERQGTRTIYHEALIERGSAKTWVTDGLANTQVDSRNLHGINYFKQSLALDFQQHVAVDARAVPLLHVWAEGRGSR
jgi:hypothetical protein